MWDSTHHNPVKMLGKIKQDKLAQVVTDEGFMAQMERVYANLQNHLTGQGWFEDKYGKFESPQMAYFSMEFGLTECLPIYSGGLGILAGDHLKSASELGLPLVGVGLLYQQGYFQQYLNADGWQQEIYPDNDFYNLPIQPETNEDGTPVLSIPRCAPNYLYGYIGTKFQFAVNILNHGNQENSFDISVLDTRTFDIDYEKSINLFPNEEKIFYISILGEEPGPNTITVRAENTNDNSKYSEIFLSLRVSIDNRLLASMARIEPLSAYSKDTKVG